MNKCSFVSKLRVISNLEVLFVYGVYPIKGLLFRDSEIQPLPQPFIVGARFEPGFKEKGGVLIERLFDIVSGERRFVVNDRQSLLIAYSSLIL
jgi:hypothetical protein